MRVCAVFVRVPVKSVVVNIMPSVYVAVAPLTGDGREIARGDDRTPPLPYGGVFMTASEMDEMDEIFAMADIQQIGCALTGNLPLLVVFYGSIS